MEGSHKYINDLDLIFYTKKVSEPGHCLLLVSSLRNIMHVAVSTIEGIE
jgi:hypothetical protein